MCVAVFFLVSLSILKCTNSNVSSARIDSLTIYNVLIGKSLLSKKKKLNKNINTIGILYTLLLLLDMCCDYYKTKHKNI